LRLVRQFDNWFLKLISMHEVDGLFLSAGFPNVDASSFRGAFNEINKNIANMFRARSWHFPYYTYARELDLMLDATIHPNVHMLLLLIGDKDVRWDELHDGVRWHQHLAEKLKVSSAAVDVQLVQGGRLQERIEHEMRVFSYIRKPQNFLDAKKKRRCSVTPLGPCANHEELWTASKTLVQQTHRFRRMENSRALLKLRDAVIAGEPFNPKLFDGWSPTTRSERKSDKQGEKQRTRTSS
jgi:hypothetical protein